MKREEIEAAAKLILNRIELHAEFEDGAWTVHDPATGACWEVITDGQAITEFKCLGEGIKEE